MGGSGGVELLKTRFSRSIGLKEDPLKPFGFLGQTSDFAELVPPKTLGKRLIFEPYKCIGESNNHVFLLYKVGSRSLQTLTSTYMGQDTISILGGSR